MDESGSMYGEERFAAALAPPAADITEFGDALFAEIEHFAGEAPQSDDRTLFVLDFEVLA